jgi:hypothetical protein
MSKEVRKFSFLENNVSDYSEGEDYVLDYAEDEDYTQLLEDVIEPEEGIVAQVFSESDFSEEDAKIDSEMTLQDALDEFVSGDASFGSLSDELESVQEDLEEIAEDYPDTKIKDLIPGSDISAEDLSDDSDVETDYKNDGDLSKFLEYIHDQYPSNIPGHDGRTTVGCERAISFLERLNSQISKAIKEDVDGVLDLTELEGARAGIMSDVISLKQHLGNLKKKLKEMGKSASSNSDTPPWTNSEGKKIDVMSDIKKEAAMPNNMVIAITPFERAISGIMVNAHVSAGMPMEDVFESLKKKYKLTDREELSIMQICMDNGFPIFKDRGSIGSRDSLDLDFMKNYFA